MKEKHNTIDKKKQLVGEVLESKMDKTAVVKVVSRFSHPVYKKYISKSKKYYAHDPQNECNVGDVVKILESKPISKLNPKKAHGADNISIPMLKLCAAEVSVPLKLIFEKSTLIIISSIIRIFLNRSIFKEFNFVDIRVVEICCDN